MNEIDAVAALRALAQASRLAVYRLLVRRGPQGYPAGEIAAQLGIPGPTLSFHLEALAQAGLVEVRRDRRFLHYRANFELMNALVALLAERYCSLASVGAPPACAPARAIAGRNDVLGALGRSAMAIVAAGPEAPLRSVPRRWRDVLLT